MTTREDFQNRWGNKWVKLSYSECGMNQMDVTKYQVVTKLTFGDAVVRLNSYSYTRSGYPSKEYGFDFIGDKPWIREIRDTVNLDLMLKEEEVYDFDTDRSTMEWKLMRKTELMEQAVEIEDFDIGTIDPSIVMPPPKYNGIKF